MIKVVGYSQKIDEEGPAVKVSRLSQYVQGDLHPR